VLVIAWLLAALRDRGPYPIIVTAGEQGSAKSTFSQILRALTDPNTAPLRSLPRDERDLFIAANNGRVIAFDNVSAMPAWLSDALCRISTGGGFATRQLHTDQDEVLFDAMRPMILNGIGEDVIARPDLADRAIVLSLAPISEANRRPEAEIMTAFEAQRPAILGALLNAVVKGLKMLPDTQLDKLPRMADFALWATACETALWPAGTFMAAYYRNLDEGLESVIEADIVAGAVRSLMGTRAEWTGTASQLLPALAEIVGERATKMKDWPDNPRALGGRLTRLATFMRKKGISISRERVGYKRDRVIRIVASALSENTGNFASAPSVVSATDEINRFARTQNNGADATSSAADANVSEKTLAKPLAIMNADDEGAADAKTRPFSGGADDEPRPTLRPPGQVSGVHARLEKNSAPAMAVTCGSSGWRSYGRPRSAVSERRKPPEK
jgi:hypothetical protein